jgi:hypothetical protein
MAVVVHVELIVLNHVDAAQPLRVEDTLEAGNEQAERVPVMRSTGSPFMP